MKKLLAILLTLTLALGMMIPIMADPTPAQNIVGYSPDRVTKITDWSEIPNILEYDNYVDGNPPAFKILDAEGLTKLNTILAFGDCLENVTVYQVYDIDMKDAELRPFGETSGLAFKGTYDGQGHVIDNLTIVPKDPDIASGAANYGFFGVVSKATLKNMVLGSNVEIAMGGINKAVDARTGGLVGTSNGVTIDNCYILATVNGSHFTGGVIGFTATDNPDVVTNTTFNGTVHTTNDTVGGIIGHERGNKAASNNDLISNCRVMGSVTGDGTAWVGGLIGRSAQPNVTMDGCIVGGIVASNGNGYVSPFLCQAAIYGHTITNCLSYADLSTEDQSLLIGMVSHFHSKNYNNIATEDGGEPLALKHMVLTGSQILTGEDPTLNTVPTVTPDYPTAEEIEAAHGTPNSGNGNGGTTEETDPSTTQAPTPTTQAPAPSTQTPSTTTQAPASTTADTSDKKSGGCGSSVALVSVIGIAAIGCAVTLKQKKED